MKLKSSVNLLWLTNFSTVHDQFEDRVNASICEMTVEDATDKITELIHNASLRQSYIDYLKQHIVDNSNEIEKNILLTILK